MTFFFMFAISRNIFLFGVVSGNINLGGDTGTNPNVFGNTDFCNKQRFEKSSVYLFFGFKVCGAKFQFSDTNFSMRFLIK